MMVNSGLEQDVMLGGLREVRGRRSWFAVRPRRRSAQHAVLTWSEVAVSESSGGDSCDMRTRKRVSRRIRTGEDLGLQHGKMEETGNREREKTEESDPLR
jgi:hypothetical protein